MLLALAGYSFAQTPTNPQWTKQNVIGLILSLNDPTHIEVLRFTASGYVTADIGIKNGPIAGPVFKWRIANNKLLIGGEEGGVIEELTLVSMDSSKVIVKRSSGQIAQFAILKPDPNPSPVVKKMDSMVIHKLHFNALDINLVLSYLTAESKDLDPDHVGIKFVLRLPAADAPITKPIYRKVSITLVDVPFTEFLAYISAQTNLEYSVEGNTVVFIPMNLDLSHPKKAGK